jgi:hypothetical protein
LIHDPISIENNVAEARQRRHRRYRRQLSVVVVERHKPIERHIGDSIAVGKHERLAIDERRKAPYAPSSQRIETGTDQMDFPGFLVAPAPLHGAGTEIDREVACHIGKLQEEILHYLGLVAKRHHELVESVGGIELHDVPENGMLADLHHWLGDGDRLLGKPSAEASGEDDDLHAVPRNGNRSCAN